MPHRNRLCSSLVAHLCCGPSWLCSCMHIQLWPSPCMLCPTCISSYGCAAAPSATIVALYTLSPHLYTCSSQSPLAGVVLTMHALSYIQHDIQCCHACPLMSACFCGAYVSVMHLGSLRCSWGGQLGCRWCLSRVSHPVGHSACRCCADDLCCVDDLLP